MALEHEAHFNYLLRQADSNLILGHRLSELVGRAPTIEEELAIANIGLDLIGLGRSLYVHAARVAGDGRDEDQLVYCRDAHDYRNLLITEHQNGDFAETMMRQLLYSAFANLFWKAMAGTRDEELAGVAAKAANESAYHLRHSGGWIVRLGDGTEESHCRAQAALDSLWMFTGEMFDMDEVDQAALAKGIGVDAGALKPAWDARVNKILEQATLKRPKDGWMEMGSRTGRHTEQLGHLLAEMQFLQRAYPGQQW